MGFKLYDKNIYINIYWFMLTLKNDVLFKKIYLPFGRNALLIILICRQTPEWIQITLQELRFYFNFCVFRTQNIYKYLFWTTEIIN